MSSTGRSKRKRNIDGGKKDNKSSSPATSSTTNNNNNNRPSWVPTKDDFPWSTSAAIYGNCHNVSSRYEKIGRIGEGTYGEYLMRVLIVVGVL